MTTSSGETVWVLPRQPGPGDAHGNPRHTWPEPGDPAAVKVEGAKVSPRFGSGEALATLSSDELNRDAVVVGLMVFLPAGARMESVDRMHVRGQVYEAIGEPGVWVNPWTRQERGVQVAVRRAEG